MNILAFDTCFDACSVAVLTADGRRFARFEAMQTGQAEALLPMIADVMDDAGLSPSQLNRIAATRGPGTFTGTRIGLSAARAICLATGAEGLGFSSLQVIATAAIAIHNSAPSPNGSLMLVARPERRGTHDVQTFDAAGQALTPPMAASPAQIAKCLEYIHADRGADNGTLLIGSGANELAAALSTINPGMALDQSGAAIEDQLAEPDARHLLSLASETLDAAHHPLTPLYLRPVDAKPSSKPSIARVQPA
ncbi:MAG: tRNA (adenosine(37)-N6)-threonylcarbamoyltransferase complex dimerization subunit type 1 TsaB [Pseudomonadota bacterium]